MGTSRLLAGRFVIGPTPDRSIRCRRQIDSSEKRIGLTANRTAGSDPRHRTLRMVRWFELSIMYIRSTALHLETMGGSVRRN